MIGSLNLIGIEYFQFCLLPIQSHFHSHIITWSNDDVTRGIKIIEQDHIFLFLNKNKNIAKKSYKTKKKKHKIFTEVKAAVFVSAMNLFPHLSRHPN